MVKVLEYKSNVYTNLRVLFYLLLLILLIINAQSLQYSLDGAYS